MTGDSKPRPRRVRATHRVGPDEQGSRLDQLAAKLWPEHSRSRLAGWIRDGRLCVDDQAVKPKFRLKPGQRLTLEAELEPHPTNPGAEPIALEVLYRDEALMVLNKPAGLVVHPGSGNRAGTLVNGLLHLEPALELLPRAGLVHRLDKDTSGCLVVARTPEAHTRLIQAMKRRDIHRHYQALVWGRMISGGHVDAPLGRHPVDRRRQVVRADGRRALTRFRIRRRLAASTLLDVELETGRTHQIRVHMLHSGHPLIGDPVYGRRGSPAGLTEAQRHAWRTFPRQALHAWKIRLPDPVANSEIVVEAPLPVDLDDLIRVLDHG